MRIANRIDANMPNHAIRSAQKAPMAKSVDSLAFGANPTVGAKPHVFRRIFDRIVKLLRTIKDKLIGIVFAESKPTNTPNAKKPPAEKPVDTKESSKEKPSAKDKASENEKKPNETPKPAAETAKPSMQALSQKIREGNEKLNSLTRRQEEVRHNIKTLRQERMALKQEARVFREAQKLTRESLNQAQKKMIRLQSALNSHGKSYDNQRLGTAQHKFPSSKKQLFEKLGEAHNLSSQLKASLDPEPNLKEKAYTEAYDDLKKRCTEERNELVSLKGKIQELAKELQVLNISLQGQKTLESLN